MATLALSLKTIAAKVLPKKQNGLSALTGNELVCDRGVPAAELPIEATDVQGLVFRGYGQLRACCYPLLQVGSAERARELVAQLAERVSPGVPAARERAVHVAFTPAGMAALGVPEDVLQQFSRSFLDGMVGPHKSRFLGDVEQSAPERWAWGGPGNPAVHVLLMLHATDEAALQRLRQELQEAWTDADMHELRTLHTQPNLTGREHFGFADGISQPAIEGYHPAPSDLHLVKAGEFLLGYVNEYDLFTERPKVTAARDPFGLLSLDVEGTPLRDVGRNGTYLVLRQLRQHVAEFRAALDELSRDPDGTPNPSARELLAAKMVGRWPSGAPLIEAPERDDVTKAHANEFRYHREDRDGLKCPIGAHVRRANPRDALAPRPGSERSLAINRRHRLIRRGRSYGEPLAEGVVDDSDRGLMLVALGANLTRQFEFVQHSWLADSRFNGLFGQSDPIVGVQDRNAFAAPADPVGARCTGLPRFVTVAGGAYFFMPGIRALRWLGRGAWGSTATIAKEHP